MGIMSKMNPYGLVHVDRQWCSACDKPRVHETMTILEIRITKCVVCGANQ